MTEYSEAKELSEGMLSACVVLFSPVLFFLVPTIRMEFAKGERMCEAIETNV